jgi:hypothetical protein
MENPKSKSQIPNKFQGLKFQNRGFALALEFGVWSLFGFWILDFGISHTDRKTFAAPALACAQLNSASRNQKMFGV